MKLSELDREVTKLGYQTEVPADHDGTIAISHDLEVSDAFGEKTSVVDAEIDNNLVGEYMIEHRIPNKLAKVIRKYANTYIDDRYPEEVAIVGRDRDTFYSDDAHYTAYDMDGIVHDDATVPELKGLTTYHLNNTDKRQLMDRLEMQNMPVPRFIPVDEIDNSLKITE